MKQDEIKVGLWIAEIARFDPVRVVWFDEKSIVAESLNGGRGHINADMFELYSIAAPEYLSRFNIPDSDRLTCQRSEWEGDGVVELPAATRTASRPWTWHEGPNEGVARNRVTKEFVRWRRDIDVLDSFLVCNTSCSQTGNSIARDFMSAKELHEHFEQLNGTPCGVALSASGSGEKT